MKKAVKQTFCRFCEVRGISRAWEVKGCAGGGDTGRAMQVKSLIWNGKGIYVGLSIMRLCLCTSQTQELGPGRFQVGRREGGCNDEGAWQARCCLGRSRACKALQGVSLWKHAFSM